MNESVTPWLWAAGTYALTCGCLGCYVSAQKKRDMLEGLIFGILLGPFGVIAAACLPDQNRALARRTLDEIYAQKEADRGRDAAVRRERESEN
jgi:hypothetical protein